MASQSLILRNYQYPMIDHIVQNPRCAVWAGMGLGKTSGTLKALDELSLVEDTYPALICAPLRVARSTWTGEKNKWSDFRHMGISPIVGTEDERKRALKQPADIYTINYENLPWLAQQLGEKWPFGTLVADESTKLKSARIRQGGQRAAALRKHAFTKIKRFIELTGTPSPNGLKDLWGQIYLLDQGQRLGRTFESFKQRWFKPSKDGFSILPLPHAEKEIQERLKDICLSLNSADYFDLKKPIVIDVKVELPPKARALYKEMEKRMFIEIETDEVEAFNAASRTNKCLQLANGAAYIDGDTKDWHVVHTVKLEALESIIEENSGVPVLVAYSFKSDLARLKKAFPKGRHINTQKDEDDFKAGKIELGFAHPASLGHGVDGFQYATNIGVFFGLDWNLENYLQFIERFGPVRQIQAGFNRNVFVYRIVASNTVDEDVLIRIETKREVQDILLEAMKYRRKL